MRTPPCVNPALLILSTLAAAGPAAAQVTVLHSFAGGPSDGLSPRASLIESGGALFGTTLGGGGVGFGTAYRINTDGTGHQLVHAFAGGVSDGRTPYGSLLQVGSDLYGMTQFNGATNQGTVFKVGIDGTGFAVLHSFASGPTDGQRPTGSLIRSGSTLYGMTDSGGASGGGTIFRIGTDGTGFALMHSFAGGPADGLRPQRGSLVQVGSALFGTTSDGGTTGVGTIFRIGIDGTGFGLLGSFGDNLDGGLPNGSLTAAGSTLYGSTETAGPAGFGTVFRIDTGGTGYELLHAFSGDPADGAGPTGVILSGSTLFGTTVGISNSTLGNVYRMEANGTGFAVLHSFAGSPSDGAYPTASLTLIGSTLYGTTGFGGTSDGGTVFSIAVPEPSSVVLTAGGVVALLSCRLRRRHAEAVR